VIAHLMGIPERMLGQFLSWSDSAAPALDLGLTYREYAVADRALQETNRWLREHFRRLRAGDGDDLLSRLVRIVDDEDDDGDGAGLTRRSCWRRRSSCSRPAS
jgi:cytochrome P450